MEILAARPEFSQKLFKIYNRDVLDRMKSDPAALLAIGTVPGYRFNGGLKPITKVMPTKGTHGYFPDFKQIQTGFVAFGPGLKAGFRIPLMGLEDVAPIVSELLKLDFKSEDGHLPVGILKN